MEKIPSPVGMLTLASDGSKLTGLWLAGQKYFACTLSGDAQEQTLPVFAQTQLWLRQYFSGRQPDLELPLAPQGSEFRQAVWRILCAIPYGQVMTYGEIAQQISRETGKQMSAQAVGGAVGHNPISIIIPCHRVVGSDGSLTGYAGGIETKMSLLKLEKVPLENFYIPKKGTAL